MQKTFHIPYKRKQRPARRKSRQCRQKAAVPRFAGRQARRAFARERKHVGGSAPAPQAARAGAGGFAPGACSRPQARKNNEAPRQTGALPKKQAAPEPEFRGGGQRFVRRVSRSSLTGSERAGQHPGFRHCAGMTGCHCRWCRPSRCRPPGRRSPLSGKRRSRPRPWSG